MRVQSRGRRRAIDSGFCGGSATNGPGGRGELDCAAIPPCLRQETERQVPGGVFETGTDIDGPNEVVDEPLVMVLAARRRVLPAVSAAAASRIPLGIPVA